jgi:hypothetical protein
MDGRSAVTAKKGWCQSYKNQNIVNVQYKNVFFLQQAEQSCNYPFAIQAQSLSM